MQENLPSSLEYQVYDPERREIQVMVVEPPKRRYWLHALLFALTIFSTLCIGARLQYDFSRNVWPYLDDEYLLPWSWALHDWHRLILGIPFSACLLGILTAHEMGHFILCVRRRVYATLPFFIPAPTLIGTFGAFIRIQSPIRNRRDLFDIGIAGPIAGFLVAVPVLVYSLLHSRHLDMKPGESWPILGLPLIFHVVHWGLAALGSHSAAAQYPPEQLYLAPAGVAAWFGMFATSLNLLPGGQLDGGHISYALNERTHRRISFLTICVLIPLGMVYSLSWFVWAIFLRVAIRHPMLLEEVPLGRKRKLIAAFGLLMLILTFAYNPLPGSGLLQLLHQYFPHK
jgi:membrane-associated protease RseP (regulator of RpoE activity)